jgi:hypothetical protein
MSEAYIHLCKSGEAGAFCAARAIALRMRGRDEQLVPGCLSIHMPHAEAAAQSIRRDLGYSERPEHFAVKNRCTAMSAFHPLRHRMVCPAI